jgi:hypothetical protein
MFTACDYSPRRDSVLRSPGEGERMEEQRPGCGIWVMWALTIGIVLFLFLVCVVLVFTSEIRLTSAG